MTVALSTGWQSVYEVDFTAQGSQTFGADGNFTIDNKVWTVTQKANSRTFDVLNGTGIRVYPNTNSTDYENPSQTSAPRIYIPVTNIFPSFSYPRHSIRIWFQSAVSGIDQNFERALRGVEKNAAQLEFKIMCEDGNNPSFFRHHLVSLISNTLQYPSGTYTETPTTDDVDVLTVVPGSTWMYSGLYSGGWPTTFNNSAINMGFSTAQQIGNLNIILGSYNNTNNPGNMTHDVKRMLVQIKES